MASLKHKFTPLTIDKDDPRHLGDLRQLIQRQLIERGVWPASDIEKAIQILVDKSEGTFVYVARCDGAQVRVAFECVTCALPDVAISPIPALMHGSLLPQGV